MIDICSCNYEIIEWIISISLAFNIVVIWGLVFDKLSRKQKTTSEVSE